MRQPLGHCEHCTCVLGEMPVFLDIVMSCYCTEDGRRGLQEGIREPGCWLVGAIGTPFFRQVLAVGPPWSVKSSEMKPLVLSSIGLPLPYWKMSCRLPRTPRNLLSSWTESSLSDVKTFSQRQYFKTSFGSCRLAPLLTAPCAFPRSSWASGF